MEPLAPAQVGVLAPSSLTSMDTTAENPCRSTSYAGAALSVTVALILEWFCWGFTVDDAWIISRVAHNGLVTGRFSFNSGGPVTDAVTPLGFAHVLAALGEIVGLASSGELWSLARWLGMGAFAASLAISGWVLGGEGRAGVLRGGALSVLALPAAAWAGAGLSTPIVGFAIVAGAILFERERWWLGAVLLGSAAAWRPELTPFLGAWILCRHLSSQPLEILLLTKRLLPFLAVAASTTVLRWLAFGQFVPLSAVAKVAEPQTALFYAAVTAIWSGLGWLILLRNDAFRRPGLWGVPWCIHLVALVFAGGDWMPALRLSAPLFPLMIWATGRSLRPTLRFWFGVVPAAGFFLFLASAQGDDWRAVAERRLRLVSEGAPFLSGARVVAATDIGWVGRATEARIVDLAGVTDPTIAALPGGHTSKAISPGLFSDRDVDTWVIRALDRSYEPGRPLEMIIAAYLVDARLLSRNADLGFIGVATIPLEGTPGQYVIARRSELATVQTPRSRDESLF